MPQMAYYGILQLKGRSFLMPGNVVNNVLNLAESGSALIPESVECVFQLVPLARNKIPH